MFVIVQLGYGEGGRGKVEQFVTTNVNGVNYEFNSSANLMVVQMIYMF